MSFTLMVGPSSPALGNGLSSLSAIAHKNTRDKEGRWGKREHKAQI